MMKQTKKEQIENTHAIYSGRKFIANFSHLNRIWKIILPYKFMLPTFEGKGLNYH